MTESSPVQPGAFAASKAIEAAIRAQIESGELRPGDPLPTTGELVEQYGVANNTVSKAIRRLKAAGVLTGSAGGRTRVRVQPPSVTRHNLRYEDEKANVHKTEDERARLGVSETDTEIPIDNLHDNWAEFEVVEAPADVASALDLPAGTLVLQRNYFRRHAAGAGLSRSVSYIPYELAAKNPDLLDASKEPWPGGTMHQLSTVGVEVGRIDDHITASMPSPGEEREYDIPPGVPVLRVRKISYDIDDRPVELADIPFPADRAKLVFTTKLERWH